MSDIEVRRTKPDEYRAAASVKERSLLQKPVTGDDWDKLIPSWDETVSYSAWLGAECVGHAAYFPVDTTVPGGARVASGAVTRVGVLTTARRRGAASQLMNTLTDTAADSGLELLSLRASEATIYPRFGYGIAGEFASVKLDPRFARPLRGAVAGGTFRILSADEITAVVPALYERVAHRRPGVITRPASFIRMYFEEAYTLAENEFVVVHTDADGNDDGYAHYGTRWSSDSMIGSYGTGTIHDLWGADDAVELALWSYLLDVDLVIEWTADERPVDDLVRYAMRDPRALSYRSVEDEQWLRLIDVDACLRARTYNPVDGEIVVEIGDPRVAANNGRWRIGADGAARDDAATADIVAPVAGLSAAYLGGRPWWALAASGQVDVANRETLTLADALFHSPRAPFCGSFF